MDVKFALELHNENIYALSILYKCAILSVKWNFQCHSLLFMKIWLPSMIFNGPRIYLCEYTPHM